MESIGYRISKVRRFRNMSQKDLAIKSGISEASLSRYENEVREPKTRSITSLADALDVSVDYLLGLSDEMEVKANPLNNITVESIESILKEAEEKINSAGVMFSGEPATKESIDTVIKSMKAGLLLALEEHRNKTNR